MTEPEPLQPVGRTCVRYRNRKLLFFSGCDYFRLASHPAVLKAARDAVKNSGLNVAASRMTTGNHPLYHALEKQLAHFFGADDALVLPDGYMAPLVVAQAWAGNFSHVLLDERSHPALLDAALMFDCPVLKFRHRDPVDFRRAITRCGGGRPVALTDGVFPMDGAVAPLQAYLEALPRDGYLVVDDAHGAGVLGETGKGTIETERVSRRRVVQCITLSKAFGTYGGAVLGPRALREKIQARSRMFIGSTPPPLPLAAAASTAIRILKTDQRLRQRLLHNTLYVKSALRSAGFAFPDTPAPIVPLQLSSERETARLKRRLLDAGIYPPFLHYPGGPAHGAFRFVVSSEHHRSQLDQLLKVLIRLVDG